MNTKDSASVKFVKIYASNMLCVYSRSSILNLWILTSTSCTFSMISEKVRILSFSNNCSYFLYYYKGNTLRYKMEGRGFDSRWCHWNCSLILSFRSHYGPGVESASNRNEYQEYFLGGKGGRCVGLTTLPTSCADCLEIWEPQPPKTLRAWPNL
jgi:hypothetical protein